MKVVAVLGRPMRAVHCRAYVVEMGRRSETQVTVITSDREDLDLPEGSNVTVFSGLDVGDSVASQIAGRSREKLARSLRSGSELGMRVETALRRVRARLKGRVSTRQVANRRYRRREAHSPNLSHFLDQIWVEESIDVIVVFDVFLLPDALEFSVKRSIDVIVR